MSLRVLISLLGGECPLSWLDIETGRLAPAETGTNRGLASTTEGNTFAVYVSAGTVWFQWNDRRWPFTDDDLPVRYSHDLATKTTTFSVADQSITYEAWWSTDPVFNPMAPELDEYWDDLGYYYALKQEPERLREMVEHWSRQA